MSVYSAFTLLELLAAIAIAAILFTVSIPHYEKYIIQARVMHMLNAANSLKMDLSVQKLLGHESTSHHKHISEYIARMNVMTLDAEQIKYLIEIEAQMSTKSKVGIGLKQPQIADDPLILQLQGRTTSIGIDWTCHVAPEYNQYVPSICRNNNLI